MLHYFSKSETRRQHIKNSSKFGHEHHCKIIENSKPTLTDKRLSDALKHICGDAFWSQDDSCYQIIQCTQRRRLNNRILVAKKKKSGLFFRFSHAKHRLRPHILWYFFKTLLMPTTSLWIWGRIRLHYVHILYVCNLYFSWKSKRMKHVLEYLLMITF